MKSADQCRSLLEVRDAIDSLDQQLIALLAQRAAYVRAAAAFKADVASVAAPERLAAMLVQRRAWAAEAGIDGEMVAQLFSGLVASFTEAERAHWQTRQPRQPDAESCH